MIQDKKRATTKKTNKLEEHHVEFILKKVAEGASSHKQIADLFNEIYGKKVTTTRQNVVYYACSGKFDDRIYDLRQLMSESVKKNCKYANISVQLAVIEEGIEYNRGKKNYKEVRSGIELIAKLTGNLVEKVEYNWTDEELQRRMAIERKKQDVWLEEFKEEENPETLDSIKEMLSVPKK